MSLFTVNITRRNILDLTTHRGYPNRFRINPNDNQAGRFPPVPLFSAHVGASHTQNQNASSAMHPRANASSAQSSAAIRPHKRSLTGGDERRAKKPREIKFTITITDTMTNGHTLAFTKEMLANAFNDNNIRNDTSLSSKLFTIKKEWKNKFIISCDNQQGIKVNTALILGNDKLTLNNNDWITIFTNGDPIKFKVEIKL